MALLRETEDENYVYYLYEMKDYDLQSAVHWINYIVNRGVISTKVITFRDSYGNYHEGNTSFQCSSIEEESIVKKLKSGSIDKITLDGKYQRASISIVYNLKEKTLAIALDKEHLVDRFNMEKRMRLNE